MSRSQHYTSIPVFIPGVDTEFKVEDVYYYPRRAGTWDEPAEEAYVEIEGAIKINDDDFTDLLSPLALQQIRDKLLEDCGESDGDAYDDPPDRLED